jgi:hypothetical protein
MGYGSQQVLGASLRLGISLLILFAGGSPIHATDDVQVAREWVAALPANILYTDGYVPAPNPPVATAGGQRQMVPVSAALYFSRAWNTFLEQESLSDEQRLPHHYKIGHEVQGNVLTVVIQGLLMPRIVDGEPGDIMRVSFGPSMRLQFALDSGRLIETLLLR